MSGRTQLLKQNYLNAPFEICPERAVLWTESIRQTEGKPRVIRNALALKHLLEKISIAIRAEELIVGNRSSKPKGSPLFPEIKAFALEAQLDTYPDRPIQPFQISGPDRAAIKKVLPYWRGKSLWERAFGLMPKELKRDVFKLVFTVEAEFQNGIGHFIVGNPNLLAKGFAGIRAEAEQRLAAGAGSDAQKEFWQAVVITSEAAINFSGRFSEEARRLAELENDPARRQELIRIARNCEKVPANPPLDFYQALQSVWFHQLICQLECGGFAISPGRLDQILYPFYRQDLAQGKITPDQAQELIECLYLKMSEVVNVLDSLVLSVTSGPPIAQSLTIGGTDRQGNDATNPLSSLFLFALDNIRAVSPNLAVRFHPDTPAEFSTQVYDAVRRGAMMSLFNDQVIVPGLIESGISSPEARDYAIVGCVEPTTSGSSFGSTDSNLVNIARCLELALNNGDGMDLIANRKMLARRFGPYLLPRRGASGKGRLRHYRMMLNYLWATGKAGGIGLSEIYPILRGRNLGKKTGDAARFQGMDEILKAYQEQVSFFVGRMAKAMSFVDQAHAELKPTPLISSTIDDCVAKGRDVTAGGARYNFTGPQAVGLAEVADSLCAVQSLVFEQKQIPLPELLVALRGNFKDAEHLRQMLIHRAPKYGNDDQLPDRMAASAARIYCEEVSSHPNFRDGKFRPGIYSMSSHLVFGILTGATPDGRMLGETLSAGVSPGRGRENKGPTAVMRSVAAVDGKKVTNGYVLNMSFNPDLLQGGENLKKFVDLNRAYFRMGGSHIQYNIISADTLRDAQRHPDQYRGLVVRVAGYSGLFTVLDLSTQNDIICRTSHGLDSPRG